MKKFSNYQYVGGEMSERDKKEQGSKFWNEGKFDNFVRPFLPEDCKEMVFVDIGCNAGVFLKQAEDMGFDRIIGVEFNKVAVKKGIRFRRKVGGKWIFMPRDMRDCLDRLPVADYVVMAMAHYYLPIEDWLKFLDRLQAKTAHCIIVTAKKREKFSKAASDSEGIREYFKHWEEVGYIPELPFEGDPFPRSQWSFSFKSPSIERVAINGLDNGNQVQIGVWGDIDDGKDPFKSRYYRILKKYRLTKNPESPSVWTEKQLIDFMNGKIELYKDVKKYGLREPIVINSGGRILDGNHRCEMIKHLGYKSILARRVL